MRAPRAGMRWNTVRGVSVGEWVDPCILPPFWSAHYDLSSVYVVATATSDRKDIQYRCSENKRFSTDSRVIVGTTLHYIEEYKHSLI